MKKIMGLDKFIHHDF